MLVLCLFALGQLGVQAAFRLDPDTRAIIEYADLVVCVIFFVDFLITLGPARPRPADLPRSPRAPRRSRSLRPDPEASRGEHLSRGEPRRPAHPGFVQHRGSLFRNRSGVQHQDLEVKKELTASQYDINTQGEIPISIRLPQGDFSNRLLDTPRRYWELEVKAETPGIDYHAAFLLPVYNLS